MRAPQRLGGAEVLRSFRSTQSYTMPRQSLLTFKKAALVCTIAHGAAATLLPAGGAALRAAAWSHPTFTAPSFALCKLHKIACCPVCHKQEYVAQRVAKAVLSGLKRLGLSKTQSVLEYLGVKTWHEVSMRSARDCPAMLLRPILTRAQVYEHFDIKRSAWNLQYPHSKMTWANAAIDHIRPVDAFQKGCVTEKTTLCNNLRNLQPLLLQDNAWKGCVWQDADEAYWRENIIRNASHRVIYYPRARQPLSLVENGGAGGV